MKREEVKGIIPGITDEQLGQIMDLNGADLDRQKQTIATLTAERDTARSQLDTVNAKLEGYDPDWKNKAQQAQQQAQQQVNELKARYAQANAAAGLKFSSASARKAFLADLAEKKLPLQEDGTLLGYEDYLKDYQKQDPGAFAAEGYPNVKDGGDPNHKPTGSTRDQFAAWFDQVTK